MTNQNLLVIFSPKDISLKSLEMFNSLIHNTTHNLTEANQNSIIQDWKNFFPGIFSSLFTICSTHHQRLNFINSLYENSFIRHHNFIL